MQRPDAMKTVLDCLESGTRYLEGRGIEDARRTMQWLVAKQLDCDRVELYAQFDRPLPEEDLAPLRDALKRRAEGEPVQHLIGTVEFAGHQFLCDRRALIPRPETEELCAEALQLSFPRPARVLDMGCGSGVLGLALRAALGEHCSELVLADRSQEALELARENAARLELPATLLHSDLFERVEGPFALIAANLPYVPDGETLPKEVQHDPPGALFGGNDGLDVIRRFATQVAEHLVPEGALAMEVGHDQAERVQQLLAAAGLSNARWKEDLSGNPRFVFADAPLTP